MVLQVLYMLLQYVKPVTLPTNRVKGFSNTEAEYTQAQHIQAI